MSPKKRKTKSFQFFFHCNLENLYLFRVWTAL